MQRIVFNNKRVSIILVSLLLSEVVPKSYDLESVVLRAELDASSSSLVSFVALRLCCGAHTLELAGPSRVPAPVQHALESFSEARCAPSI